MPKRQAPVFSGTREDSDCETKKHRGSQGKMVSPEELYTIGLAGDGTTLSITENSIRAEHGLGKRVKYYES